MPYTHESLSDIVNTECGGNWNRIMMFSSSNGGRPMYLPRFRNNGSGWRYVNEGDRNGFEIYAPIPPSDLDQLRMITIAGVPITHQTTFFPLDLIDHISWIPILPPLWIIDDVNIRVNGDGYLVDQDGQPILDDKTKKPMTYDDYKSKSENQSSTNNKG